MGSHRRALVSPRCKVSLDWANVKDVLVSPLTNFLLIHTMPTKNRPDPTPKYKAGDRVKEREVQKLTLDAAFYKGKQRYNNPRKGVVKKHEIKRNSKGSRHFYYEVLWDGFRHASTYPQHRIEKEN